MISLTVLGSGTCLPSIHRGAPGYHLAIDGRSVLLDCGSGVCRQLARAGIDFRDLDLVTLSHFHPDHVSDLAVLMQALMISTDLEPDKIILVGGPKKIGEFYRSNVLYAMGSFASPEVSVVDLGSGFTLGACAITSCRARHSGGGLCLRFVAPTGTVVYTGDSELTDELVALAREADLLIADASFFETSKLPGHMSAADCGILAHKAQVRRLLLSHFYPSDRPDEERLAECRNHYDGKILLAHDLMTVHIP